MAQRRDSDRTREKILQAARIEFAAKGLAGARVDVIARRARVNKQMLYYCFGDKRELYHEVLRLKLRERMEFLDAMPHDIAGALVHIFDSGGSDVEFIRMLEWEALDPPRGKAIAEDERRQLFEKAVGRIGMAQAAGLVPAEADPAQLFISFIALCVFPIAFPQMIRMTLGVDPASPRFRRDRREFLKWLGGRLGGPAGASAQPVLDRAPKQRASAALAQISRASERQ